MRRITGSILSRLARGMLLVASLALVAPPTFAAVTSQVVDLPTRGVTQRILDVRPDVPVANVIVLSGGDGYLGIRDDGTMVGVAGGCGPFARNRQAFADRGFALALVDTTSDGLVWNYPDVLEVVRYMKSRANVPTWIVGGSAASGSIVGIGNTLPAEEPVGLIVFSPTPVSAAAAALVKRPTLVIFHTGDTTQQSGSLFNALTSTAIKERIGLSGGSNTACSGFHLFNGIDAQFIGATTGFIDRHNPALANPTPSVAVAVEFYNAALDHYFLTHIANEIALLDAGITIRGWARTGQSFNVYTGAQAGSSPVCRYYIPPDKGDSHFYGRGSVECAATGAANPTFVNEDGQFFHVMLPAAGVCPAGTRDVYRVFSDRVDANHRYMVDRATRDLMVSRRWIAEGDGADRVVMCSPE